MNRLIRDCAERARPRTARGETERHVETADHVLLVTVPDTVGVARAYETLKGLAVAVPRERLGAC